MKHFQSFRVDTINQCLWQGETRIQLTPKAFGVLCYIVDHAGRLVTQEELLEALWPGIYINPEVLRKYVLEIRRALGDRPDEPVFIKTWPKRGYQFVASVVDEASASGNFPAVGTERIVGRRSALASFEHYLKRARQRERQVIFITGETGIGKTALVDEFQRRARVDAPEICIIRGQCIEGYGCKEPYYPILEAAGQLCRVAGADAVAQVFTRHAPTWLAHFPVLLKHTQQAPQYEILGTTQEHMLREISEALETIASERLLLVLLEDLHWVDHFTVDLISALARRRQPAKLIIVGTYRPVDLALSDHPLRAVKQDLLIHSLCNEIALSPLNENEVAEYLVGHWGGATVPEGLAKFIHDHSEGNPLFMVTVLQHMKEQRFVTEASGLVRLTLPLEEIDFCIPESLRQMIEIQIERLTLEERVALEVASVSGVLFATAAIAAAAKMDEETLETLCERLARRQQIVRFADPEEFPDGTPSERYEFIHALYRDTFYRRQSPARRAKVHLKIGERLEALYAQGLSEVAAELAYHFELGRDWPRAIKYLQLASESAGQRFESRRALEILEHALDVKNRLPEAERAYYETTILERLATIHVAFVGLSGLLKQTWDLILANSGQHAKPTERAFELASEFKDNLLRARTVIRWSLCNVLAGDWNRKHLEECRTAIDVIRERANRLILGSNLIDYSLIQFFSSEYLAAYRSAIEGRTAITEESESNPYLKEARLHQYVVPWSLLFAGKWGEALRETNEIAAKIDQDVHYAQARANRLYRAYLSLFALDFAGVLEICEPMLPLLKSPSDVRFCSILIATAELNLGKHERAHTLLCWVQEDMARQEVVLDWYRRMLIESTLTELWLAKSDLVQAQSEADKFLKVSLKTGERTWQTLAWDATARVAMAQGDMARAQDAIGKGLNTIEGFEVPVASWRVQATAFEFYQKSPDRNLAERYLALSRETIGKLANSLPIEHPLRQTFQASSGVQKVLGAVR